MSTVRDEVQVIAEAAQGYEGDPAVAKLLVRSAAAAGADAVKFQIVFADDIAQPGYQYFDTYKTLEMSAEEWLDVRRLADDVGVAFYADVSGPRAVEVLRQLGADGVKFHASNFFNEDLHKAVAGLCPVTLVSIGGIHLNELLSGLGRMHLDLQSTILMYGFQAEPTALEANNLKRIPKLQQETGVRIGFMDHTDGDSPYPTTASLLALAMGVRHFERHITLSRSLEMEDYVSALGPDQLRQYVTTLRKGLQALGSNDLDLTDEEIGYREKSLKRVVALSRIEAGETFTRENVSISRPVRPTGIHQLSDALGRKAARVIEAGEGVDKEAIV